MVLPRCPSPLDSGFRRNDGRCAHLPKGRASPPVSFVHPLRGGGFETRPYHASHSRGEGEVLPLPLDVQGGIKGGLETLR